MIDGGIIRALGDYLGYGAIGLGLGVAVLSAILLLGKQQNNLATGSRYMMFGLALVVIGAALELIKAYQASEATERAFVATQNLPDEFWNDFLLSRQQKLFGTAEPTDEYANGYLKDGEEKIFSINIPKNECRAYFAAVRPPAKIYTSLEKNDAKFRSLVDKEYYKTGKICNIKDNDEDIYITIVVKQGGQYSVSAFRVVPDDFLKNGTGGIRSSPPQLSKLIKRACTGEYEANCAGSHDAFFTCGYFGSDEEIAAKLCGGAPSKAVRINTKGGNKCGYSLIEITCG